ncbi:MAG: PDR/VanB family oxidoreductase [Microbacterium sp.]|uniref:PDR/VanB family oxidoreductase n=1 Tax=Microbacterium sp. TaxID=51671 RepID=UPI0039E4B071
MMLERELEVRALRRSSPEVLVVELVGADGRALPAWEPGAHVELSLGDARIRHYSLCGDPADTESWTIAVLLDENGRGGSRWIHENFAVGVRVRCRAVRNTFALPSSRRYLFVAGGIGITPILPMLQLAHERRADWSLVHCIRDEGRFPESASLDRWGGRVHRHVSVEHGRVDVAALVTRTPPGTVVVCCGPSSLTAALRGACETAGREVVFESFGGSRADAACERGASFVVELARSGMSIEVGPDQSVLEALELAGCSVASSCREGYCGTCETVVLEGDVEHRDSALTAEEQDESEVMMVCVSRSRGARLVLSL